MARPTRTIIENGQEAWDADVNDNFQIVFDQPFPPVEVVDLATLNATYPANMFDTCLAVVTTPSVQYYYSDGATWVPFPTGDPFAIHDNVAGEINAVAAKASPVAADLVLIEDSADSFNKKKAQVGDLVPAGSITNADLADMAQALIKGRAAGAGTGPPQDLTPAQATAILDVFTSALKGLVPASGGGTTNFLRADGTWTAPPGGGSFGQNYTQAVSEAESTTTATTYQNKLSVVLPAITGTMVVQWYIEHYGSVKDKDYWLRVRNVTDAVDLAEIAQRGQTHMGAVNTCTEKGWHGTGFVTLAGASKTINLEYKTNVGDLTAKVRRARFAAWRVS